MTSTQLNLETVTPMFLRGYDNRTLELRPPPFKALFRYWWRTVQDCDWKSLQEAEGDLFGSTKGKAPFSIRIPGTTNLNPTQYKALPHKPDNDRRSIMDAYEGGQSFDLCLITKSESDACLCKQIAKLGFLLGGVGNRSRRGFGSIRSQDWNSPDVTNLRQEILKTLNDVAGVNQFQIKDHIIKSTLANFPDYPVIWRIYFGHPTNDIDGLLEDIGWATHDHSDRALGGINPRMASPIHVRIQKVGDQFVPIVTQLNSVFPGTAPHNYEQKQQDFINAVIT
jgi:CRISPR-associated protein Cmr1